jgi:hypothetical protein
MSVLSAAFYSFVFGLLHGVLPDEHTWPITFSYAIGGATGRAGMKAGLYFSAAFTVQRMVLSELAYLALAPFLLSPVVNGVVYAAVGVVMSAAGAVLIRRNHYLHLHVLHYPRAVENSIERTAHALMEPRAAEAPPARWTVVHGFIAGFGFGGFSLFINTVAAPAMPGAWLGFLPGLLFGLGTMATLVIISAVVGASLRRARWLSEAEIKRLGAQTGGRTLFFGGILFAGAGAATLLGLDRYLPLQKGDVLIGLFMVAVALPAFVYSLREVRRARRARREQ